jgi:hypothetical protein
MLLYIFAARDNATTYNNTFPMKYVTILKDLNFN